MAEKREEEESAGGGTDLTPKLVVADFASDHTTPLPKGCELVGHLVHWSGHPSFGRVAVLLEPKREVRPGEFLGLWHGRRAKAVTILQVADAIEVNPNEVPDLAAARGALGLGRGYGEEGVSTRIFRLADATTLEEFDANDGPNGLALVGEGRAPQLLGRAGDPVFVLSAEAAIQAFGGLPVPEMGIHLGETQGASPVPVTVVPSAFQMHIGIFGNPGKGKSYLSGNLLEEAASWGVPALVLDINGEMAETARALGGLVITLPDPKAFGMSLSLIQPRELVAVTPNVQPGTIYAELIELAHDQLRVESRGKDITFDQLKHRIADLAESTKATKTSVGAALARIGVLERDPLFNGKFDFIESLLKHRVVVLDCRFLSVRQTQLIAAAGARELQRVGREMARKAEQGDKEAAKWLALYFVDEAHVVIPDDEHVISTQVHYELARMGRHVRTGLVLASQSPQDLNSSVLKRLQMRFIFALERDQLRSIQGVLADLDEKIVGQLPKLPRGVCAVSGSSELVRHGFLLRVRKRQTPVGGGTPSVFATRNKKSVKVS